MTALEVAAAVLAAGASARLGRPKQLLDLRGRPLVRAVADEVCAVCSRVSAVVGTGPEAPDVERALEGSGVTLLWNEAWREGMAASVRAGASWASALPCCEALLLVACDQPRLRAAHLAELVAAWHREGRGRAVGSGYDGVVGVPALFPRAVFPRLLALCGQEGARSVLREADAVRVDWADGALDVDTPDDLARMGS